MAYQAVGTPRFLINNLEWLDALGLTNIDPLYRTLPVSNPAAGGHQISYSNLVFPKKCFYAVLGHNAASHSNCEISFQTGHDVVAGMFDPGGNGLPVFDVNIGETPNLHHTAPEFSGFTIKSLFGDKLEEHSDYIKIHLLADPSVPATSGFTAGSIIFGSYYDMPHSPDLSLTMTRDYEGYKTIETKGGVSLSNSFYSRPPLWDNLGAWELWNQTLTTPSQAFARSGRRTWDLSFSYLDDGDVFGSNQQLSQLDVAGDFGLTADAFDEDDVDVPSPPGNNNFLFNLLTDDNFYSQVIHKTNGGQFPFIFQPDKNDNSNFAIAKFVGNSFKFEQVANGVYNVKLKIREVW